MILHMDMNSFFASVEQQVDPSLRCKPVVVLAYMSPKGVVLASSVEAKRDFGIKTGMTYKEAQERCPHVIARTGRTKTYRLYSQAFMKLLHQYSPLVEQYSIDEAFVNIDWSARSVDEAIALAHLLKHRLRTEIGEWLRASVGIAPTRFLAKLAGDSMKPDGLVVLTPQDLPNWYVGREVESAWGIGPAIGKKLRGVGIYTLDQLYDADAVELFRLFGKSGYGLWLKMHGREYEELETDRITDQKSISAQYSLPFKTTKPDELASTLMKMCERVGRRLRRQNKMAGRIFCFWRCLDGSGDAVHEDFNPRINQSYSVYEAAMRMISKSIVHTPYRLVSVGVSRLIQDNQQQRLFDDYRDERISNAMDRLNDRYGEYTVFHGAMAGAQDYAKEAVGFRKIS